MADLAAPDGLTIAPAPAMARYSLRARDPAALEAVIGRELPRRIGTTAGAIACLGPDEWLLRLPAGETVPTGEGQPVSVVDVSERSVGFTLTGPRAIDAIQAGCPRDVAALAVGAAVRTIWEEVEILLFREGEEAFTVEVWRSFAPWLELALATAARSLR